jgi:cytochrome b6-f complex iron-sulfur subunit
MKVSACPKNSGCCTCACAKCPVQTVADGGEPLSPEAAGLASVDSRRSVLRRAILGIAGLGLAGVAAGCESAGQERDEPAVGKVTVARADVPPIDGAPYRSSTGKFYLARNADGVLAFSWRCTHRGCEVPWKEDEQRFHCPCHGSIYDRNGVRTDGPAPRPLDLVRLEVLDNGDVSISPRETTRRSSYEADQAVPYPSADTAQAG